MASDPSAGGAPADMPVDPDNIDIPPRPETAAEWQRLVRTYFRGAIKPPFNDSARDEAGLSRDFYGGLAEQEYV